MFRDHIEKTFSKLEEDLGGSVSSNKSYNYFSLTVISGVPGPSFVPQKHSTKVRDPSGVFLRTHLLIKLLYSGNFTSFEESPFKDTITTEELEEGKDLDPLVVGTHQLWGPVAGARFFDVCEERWAIFQYHLNELL